MEGARQGRPSTIGRWYGPRDRHATQGHDDTIGARDDDAGVAEEERSASPMVIGMTGRALECDLGALNALQ